MPALTITFISIALMATTHLDCFSRARYTFPVAESFALRRTVSSRSHERANLEVLNRPHSMIRFVAGDRLPPEPFWGERNGVHGIMMWSGEGREGEKVGESEWGREGSEIG